VYHGSFSYYSLRILILEVDFFSIFDNSFYLKKIIYIYKIISNILNLFSEKSTHNKYIIIPTFLLNKMNSQILDKKSIMSTIKI
jgi:hypothetical protein